MLGSIPFLWRNLIGSHRPVTTRPALLRKKLPIRLPCRCVAMLEIGSLAFAVPASAQTLQTVPAPVAVAGTIFEGSLKGDETVKYVVAGAAGQMLSVDLSASNTSLFSTSCRRARPRRFSLALHPAMSPIFHCPQHPAHSDRALGAPMDARSITANSLVLGCRPAFDRTPAASCQRSDSQQPHGQLSALPHCLRRGALRSSTPLGQRWCPGTGRW